MTAEGRHAIGVNPRPQAHRHEVRRLWSRAHVDRGRAARGPRRSSCLHV